MIVRQYLYYFLQKYLYMLYTFSIDSVVDFESAAIWVSVNRKWIRMVEINMKTEIIISIVCIYAIGCENPILCANYYEVPLSNTKPPIIAPEDWHPAWIILISLALLSYFKHKASREISWRLSPKYMKKHIIANLWAWLKSV